MKTVYLVFFTTIVPIVDSQYLFYYTGGSTVINNSSCPISICTQCATGLYNKDCGLDSKRLNNQSCQPCTGLPSNAQWSAWGAYPDGIGNSSAICKWQCRYQYILQGGVCVRGNCSVTIQYAELTPGSDYPNCTSRCQAGYYGDSPINATYCSGCGLGTYSLAGSTTCSKCPTGKYLDTLNGKDILDCKTTPAGTYTSVNGSILPVNCPAGTWSGVLGAQSNNTCQICPVGHYCPEASSSPTPCPTGTFANVTGNVNSNGCINCPAGSYGLIVGAYNCTLCYAGTYSVVEGANNAGVCQICPAGRYCPIGTVSPFLCSSGTYSAAQGQTSNASCIPCVPYYYQPSMGSTACLPCQFCGTGEFRNNCGGSSPGLCYQCTNMP